MSDMSEADYWQEVRRIAREAEDGAGDVDELLHELAVDSDWASDWQRVCAVLRYSPAVGDLDALVDLADAAGAVDLVCLCAQRCLEQDAGDSLTDR